MFQFVLFIITIVIFIIAVFSKFHHNYFEQFKSACLWKCEHEIFRQKKCINGENVTYLDTLENQCHSMLCPRFKPKKNHSITFSDYTTQIGGPIKKPLCPIIGIIPSDQILNPNRLPYWRDYYRIATGHELLSQQKKNFCQCDKNSIQFY
jgi:hypothetical protein